ncbi:MAG: peptidase C14 caspase catalytic subunit [Planctomycetota bacterium]|nr:MAG: peptidase C14 caspase catalytic subunit [Planctomycetota bacterium]
MKGWWSREVHWLVMRRIVVPLLALVVLAGVFAGLSRLERSWRASDTESHERVGEAFPGTNPPDVRVPGHAASATFEIHTLPGASVHIDRVLRGILPPDSREIRIPGVSPGKHRLRVAVPHRQAYVEDIVVPAGGEVVRDIPSFGEPVATRAYAEKPSIAQLGRGGALLILTEPHVCAIQCPTLDWTDHLKLRRWLAAWNVPPGRHVLRFEAGASSVERTVTVQARRVTNLGVNILSGRDLELRDSGEDAAWADFEQWTGSGAASRVTDISICADGSRAVSCDSAFRVRLWRIGKEDPIEVAHGKDVANKVAISRNGGHVAASDFNHCVWVWEADTRTRLATFEDTRGAVRALSIGPSGSTVAALDSRGSVFEWDVPSRRLLWSHPTGSKVAEDVVFSPDGALVAVANRGDKPVQVYEAASGKLLQSFGSDASAFTRVALSSDPPQVFAIRTDGTLAGWDWVTREPVHLGETEKWFGASFSGHERACLAVVKSLVFQRESLKSVFRHLEALGNEGPIAISEDGVHAVVGDRQGQVRRVKLK